MNRAAAIDAEPVRAGLSADHIVPVIDIVELPGFERLPPNMQAEILRTYRKIRAGSISMSTFPRGINCGVPSRAPAATGKDIQVSVRSRPKRDRQWCRPKRAPGSLLEKAIKERVRKLVSLMGWSVRGGSNAGSETTWSSPGAEKICPHRRRRCCRSSNNCTGKARRYGQGPPYSSAGLGWSWKLSSSNLVRL